MKIFVDSGARLDAYPIDGENSLVYYAIRNKDLSILKYLMIEKSVPIPEYVEVDVYDPKQTKLSLQFLLETSDSLMGRDEEQLKIKNEILSFLQANDK